jgi:hypothetical protein
MTRRFLNLLTALSLLLCVAVVALWARSYAPRDFTLGGDRGRLMLMFTDGQWTSFARGTESFTMSFGDLWRLAQGQAGSHGDFLGAAYVSRSTQMPAGGGGGNTGRFLMVAVPFVYPAALAAAGATWAVAARARHARRSRVGACRKCGYDLTGNASGVCPEGGSIASVSTTG